MPLAAQEFPRVVAPCDVLSAAAEWIFNFMKETMAK